jgi:hypothetical protein
MYAAMASATNAIEATSIAFRLPEWWRSATEELSCTTAN